MLVISPLGLLTVTKPLLAPTGTVVVRKVSEATVKLAAVPLKETPVVPVRPCPRIFTLFPVVAA